MAAKKKQSDKIHHIKKAKFLAAYGQCGVITRAAEIAGVHRQTPNEWIASDPKFAKDFDNAFEEAADRLEEEARRRAHDGLRKMKFYQGEPIIDPDTGQAYIEHEYSDVLLMFKLKSMRPEKFRDNMDVTSGGKPVVVSVIRGVSAKDLM